MTDEKSVEKLESHEFIGWYDGFHSRDAEIERLTAERDKWRQEANQLEQSHKIIIAERDRLRGALEQIVRMDKIDGPFWRTARRALAEGTIETTKKAPLPGGSG